MTALRSARLSLHELDADDAQFIVELLNDDAFIRYIGDKQVRDPASACRYIETGPAASYQTHGFGLYRVDRHEDGQPIGICGLVQRDYLSVPDIGFAYLARYCRRGYGKEAAELVIEDAWQRLGLVELAAICDPQNAASISLLKKLGFVYKRRFQADDNAPWIEDYRLQRND
ncbi:MAG: GNAT family N-acetyltransferase [Wenzhouxiangellaceae bacterium]